MGIARLPELWKILAEQGAQKMFRLEKNPARLLKERFLENPSMTAATEPAGIYFAKSKKDLGRLINPFGGLTEQNIEEYGSEVGWPMIEAMAMPGAKTRSFTNPEWWEFLGDTGEQVGLKPGDVWNSLGSWGYVPKRLEPKFEKLRTKLDENLSPYDIIDIPDVYFGRGSRMQTVVRRPGSVLAKVGEMIIPLSVGGAIAMPTEEAYMRDE